MKILEQMYDLIIEMEDLVYYGVLIYLITVASLLALKTITIKVALIGVMIPTVATFIFFLAVITLVIPGRMKR